jgi:acetyl-CoA acetyltransferase
MWRYKKYGKLTVANVAPWADGAASLVMLSDERAQELGCKPLIKMCGFGIAAGSRFPLLLKTYKKMTVNQFRTDN